ncbi:MAG TPA: hypothetical protein VFZ00_13740 [Solirubrobacter sp.]|nr:hypothetical protein [Solirubrobacter sp.]
MMNAFDELERQLRRATRNRLTQRKRWPRRGGLALVTMLLVGGTALAAGTTEWSPILGDDDRGHPVASHEGAPATQAAVLGVLRRPQGPADRSAEVEALLRLLPAGMTNGIHLDGVRLVARFGDQVTILVPMKRAGSEVPGLPNSQSVREDALCLIMGSPRQPHHESGKTDSGGAGSTCGTLADLTAGRIVWTLPALGLVPDGVAQVEVNLSSGDTVTARVHDNVYDLRTASRPEPFAIQPVRWLDATGNDISKP